MNDEVEMLQCQVRFLENDNRALKQTLRDQFAMAALTGLLSHYGDSLVSKLDVYEYADAMLEARKS